MWNDVADACVFIMNNIEFKDIKSLDSQASAEIKNTHINIGAGKDLRIVTLQLIKGNNLDSKVNFYGMILKPDGYI